jgi:hypothetical protein
MTTEFTGYNPTIDSRANPECRDKDFRLNKRNRKRLEALQRMHDRLYAKVNSDRASTHERAECTALFWAMRVLESTLESECEL